MVIFAPKKHSKTTGESVEKVESISGDAFNRFRVKRKPKKIVERYQLVSIKAEKVYDKKNFYYKINKHE